MELLDTHSHLFLPEFDSDRDQVISNAIAQNINKIILPNIDSGTIAALTSLVEKYPENCFPTMGLHPTSVTENYIRELNIVEKQLETNKFVAIGESGIDLYWDKTYLKEQCDAFSIQLDMARNLKIPIIIHCRESFDEIIEILERKADRNLFGIFHSFTGTLQQANSIISLGFKIGINGVVTFKNSKLPEVIRQIPLSEIVLETDSPYLTPAPHRGKRNESAFLLHTAQKIADIKNEPLEFIASTTTQTAKKLFNFH